MRSFSKLEHVSDRPSGPANAIRAKVPVTAQKGLVRLRMRVRRPFSAWRALPDFMVIGAQRCGTSSLYKYLEQHPDVIASLRKEVEYFSLDYPRGEAWYRVHFPLVARIRLSAGFRGRRPLTFEASPGYMLDPRAPERAISLVPQVRLIAMLRNPADRAFSHYQHNRRLDHEPLTFEDALESEEHRISGELERMLEDPSYRAKALRRFSYVLRGMYADQLTNWLAHFPRDRMLVVRSEDFYNNTPASFETILRFLGLPDWEPPFFQNFSYRGTAPASATMAPETRRHLTAVFTNPNRKLVELLGPEIQWDL